MGKRINQWLGGAKSLEPQTDASTGVSDVIEMIPAIPRTAEIGAPTQLLIEAIYMHFSIKRILITDFDALGFLVYQTPVGRLVTTLYSHSMRSLWTLASIVINVS